MLTLAWENFGLELNPSESELFRAILKSVSKPFWNNLKNFFYLVWWKTAKNQSDLSRSNSLQFEWIRTNFTIRMNLRPESFGLVRTHSDWFLTEFHQIKYKTIFVLVRKQSSERLGIADSLGLNSNSKILPGLSPLLCPIQKYSQNTIATGLRKRLI